MRAWEIVVYSRREGTMSAEQVINDPVIANFGRRLRARYGDRLERAVLFGSRARGDAHRNSDYDVAVFLNGLGSFGTEAACLADIETDILFETGAVINSLPFPAGGYNERNSLMAELRRDGIDL